MTTPYDQIADFPDITTPYDILYNVWTSPYFPCLALYHGRWVPLLFMQLPSEDGTPKIEIISISYEDAPWFKMVEP